MAESSRNDTEKTNARRAKPKSVVWSYVTEFDNKVTCNYCSQDLCKSAARIKYHLANACSKVTAEVRELIKFEDSKGIGTKQRRLAGEVSKLDNFVDKVPKREKEEIDILLSRFIFLNNIPFDAVESESFVNLMNKVKPAYKLPTRKAISENLLQQEYEMVKSKTLNELQRSDHITIIIDGWTNVRRESIINIIACSPTPHYLKSIPTKDEVHSADNMFEMVKKEIVVYEKQICAIITDNAANMTKLREAIKAEYENIETFGCAAHGLNLIIKDLTLISEFKEIIEAAKMIVNEINNSAIKLAKFDEIRKNTCTRLKTYTPIRWYSLTNMLQSVLDAKEVLIIMAVNAYITNSVNVENIISSKLWSDIEFAMTVIKPVTNEIGIVEGDCANISQIPQVMNSIIAIIDTVIDDKDLHLKEKVKEILCKRREFIETKVHYFANLLDPRYQGKPLSNEQMKLAYDYFDKLVQRFYFLDEQAVLSSLQSYLSKAGCYSPEFLWRENFVKNPLLWWKGFERFESEQEFAKLAVKLFSIPTSSAAVERNFSCQSLIHSKLRNRLSNENVEKLLTIQFNSRKANSTQLLGHYGTDSVINSEDSVIELCEIE